MLQFKLPEVGENIKSGTVVKIFVSAGNQVKKDQDLLELETDKASLPVPSPCDGVIKEVFIKEGEEVAIGQVVMNIQTSGAKAGAPKEPKPAGSAPVAPIQQAQSTQRTQSTQQTQKTQQIQPVMMQAVTVSTDTDVPAAPSVRRLARELGLNLGQVRGTGPRGRISKDDVKAFAKLLITSGGMQQPAAAPVRPLPDFTKFGEVDRQPMNNIRKKTADHLSYCWNTIPHVTQFDKADLTELDKIRKNFSTKGHKMTITPFIMKIMAAALKEFPQFNTSVDMDTHQVIYKKYFHIGVAVDTDRGLLVPVVRNVDKKSILELVTELGDMAERARTKKTSLDELQGGSMTLTNLGGIGGTSFTPIVNWPEVAILGISRGAYEPVLEGDKFVPRMKLPLSLSYDHRIVDGADGARFLRWVCNAIEKPIFEDLK